jgi:4-hydroxyacetophenone monooxygenase
MTADDDVVESLEAPRPLPLADDEQLTLALDQANVVTLLLAYVHLTLDDDLLERFAPHIKPLAMQQPDDLPAALIEELRGKMREVLVGRVPVAARAPSDALLRRMMSVGVGDAVDDEFVPLLYDQIGLRPDQSRSSLPGRLAPPDDFTLLQIGLGLSGIAMAVELLDAGYRTMIVERNPDIGGTWYLNTYPGVGVDTPSHFYSFSFAQWSHWTHFKPKGDEMQRYFGAVVDKYGLRNITRFSTSVESCRYDEDSTKWHVDLRGGDGRIETVVVDAVVNAGGFVHRARMPDIAGLADFAGPAVHTARWDRSVDLRGKRVAVIGTGASGVQVVPAIADDAAHVTVFMRRKYWVLNNRETDVAVPPGGRYAIRSFPHYREWLRFRVYWQAGDGNYANVLLDPAYEGNPLAVSPTNERLREFAIAQLREQLADRPDLFEQVLPDFPIFSKRIISHPAWWDTLKRDDVRLVTTGIDHIEAGAVCTADGERHEVDVLVLATGFDFARMHGDLDVRGRDGHALADEWGDDDPRAYMGVLVPGYPNYFHMNGPNSGPNFAGGVNIVAETQAHYIVECLDHALANGARALEPSREAFMSFNDMIDDQLTRMIWSHPGSDSYYQNRNRRPYMSWPFRLVDYWHRTRGPVADDMVLHPRRVESGAGRLSETTTKENG